MLGVHDDPKLMLAKLTLTCYESAMLAATVANVMCPPDAKGR